MENVPQVTILTVNHNGKSLLGALFDSLFDIDYPREKFEVLMVDNASTDGSADFVKDKYSWVKVVASGANNYCQALNLGIRLTGSEFVATLNNDCCVERGWLVELVRALTSDPQVAAAGSKILGQEGSIQSVGHEEYPYAYFSDKGFCEPDRGQHDVSDEVKSVSGCSVLYRRSALVQAGDFDADYNMYMEDVDMAYRIRKNGWKIVYQPASRVVHRLHGSGQSQEFRRFFCERNRLLFLARHFPERLAGEFFGVGAMAQFGMKDLQRVLSDVLAKLVECQGAEKALGVFRSLAGSAERIEDFVNHLQRTEAHYLRADFHHRLAEKDTELKRGSKAYRKVAVNEQVLKEQSASFKALLLEKERQLEELVRQNDSLLRCQSEMRESLQQRLDALEARNAAFIAQERAVFQREQAGFQREQAEFQRERVRLEEEVAGLKRYSDDLAARLAVKTGEVDKIYNSECYRLLLKPLVWPALDMIKKAGTLLGRRRSLGQPAAASSSGVILGHFVPQRSEAVYHGENTYALSCTNSGARRSRVKLMIDIWVRDNVGHPDGHYAYFVSILELPPWSSKALTVCYDWDRGMSFSAKDGDLPLIDSWRGNLQENALYTLQAVVAEPAGNVLHSLSVVQKLSV